ncbi:DUF1345 domain-containing protein [Cellulomonas sp. C5510]|uniref:DUF1345 domain-containing protein n=1 Tax=Cellulomonas sp. C5510 TaxID=2871170 RepID=UPI001C97E2E3|nr:DUF1345 domain-containing protein [Cellulomonas sp. C5510]QZN84966.1 DUF1345 domain-containing protein [Cellulomonas sp. C5510]
MTAPARSTPGLPARARLRLVLARDLTRSTIAIGAGLVPGLALSWADTADDRWSFWEAYARSMLVVLTGASIGYGVLTVLAFGGLAGPRLQEALRAGRGTPGSRRPWIELGTGAVGWSLVTSAGALVTGVSLARGSAWVGGTGGLVLGLLLVASAWLTMVAAYAVHYARRDATQGGMEFPGSGERAFSDYVYLAVAVGTTFAPNDVVVTCRAMRRTLSGHAVVAFAFNAVIVGLVVAIL